MKCTAFKMKGKMISFKLTISYNNNIRILLNVKRRTNEKEIYESNSD